MQLLDLIHDSEPPQPWAQGDNIPWHEPEFSARMLREHLTPEHDLASRRAETIDRHVAWIHSHVLGGRAARILDLCCGPGLYGTRLAAKGHEYTGIDYSPASIAHARQTTVDSGRCTFAVGDVRDIDFGTGFDLVMMIYGEFNVFRPRDIDAILRRAQAALAPGGGLLIEPHTAAAIRAIGDQPNAWSAHQTGLFADQPHLCLETAHWSAPDRVATKRFFIIDAASGAVTRYAASYQAYTDDAYRALLADHGFADIVLHPSLTGDPDPSQPALRAITARREDK